MDRKQNEILARIARVQDMDWMGTTTNDLMKWLDFENAKEFLKEGVSAEKWAELTKYRLAPLDEVRKYLPFAWDKANNCRGLSAGRSLDHMKAWLWLAGYADTVTALLEDYDLYGKPQLIFCSELVGFDWRQHDSGDWVSDEVGPSYPEAEKEKLVSHWTELAKDLKRAEMV